MEKHPWQWAVDSYRSERGGGQGEICRVGRTGVCKLEPHPELASTQPDWIRRAGREAHLDTRTADLSCERVGALLVAGFVCAPEADRSRALVSHRNRPGAELVRC